MSIETTSITPIPLRTRRARVGVAALRAVLAIAAASVVIFSVLPMLIGHHGLDLTNGMLGKGPIFGQYMSVDVHLTEGYFDRVGFDERPSAFTWKDTSNGTVDAATGLPPVELGTLHGPTDLVILGPTWTDRFSFTGPALFVAALNLAVLFLLFRIVGTVASGEVFSRANAHRITWIAALSGIGGSAAQLLTYLAHQGIVDRSAAAGIVIVPFAFSFLPLVIGAVILILAEVFRQGVRLRDDVDGLV